jgi:hypothetical protein
MPANAESTWRSALAEAILLIRMLVGWVFLSEGIRKFLFPDSLGAGRFVKIASHGPGHDSVRRGGRDCLWLSAFDRSCHAAGDGAATSPEPMTAGELFQRSKTRNRPSAMDLCCEA